MSDKHKITLEHQVKQSREIKRLKADNARMRAALSSAMDFVPLIEARIIRDRLAAQGYYSDCR